MVRTSISVARLFLALAALLIPTAVSLAGEVKSQREWKSLYKTLKRDLFGENQDKREGAIRGLGQSNWPEAAEILLDVVRKPNPRLIPLEKRRPVVLKEIQKYVKRARSQGNRLALEDIKTLENLETELRNINKMIGRDSGLKRLAVEMLSTFTQEKAVEWILEEALSHNSWRARLGLLEALGSLKDDRAEGTLKEALAEDDTAIRSRALESLARRGVDAGYKVCLDAMNDEFWQVRAVAIAALGRFGEIEAVEPLIEALKTETGRMRGDIAVALTRLTGKTLDADYELWKSWWASDEHKKDAKAVCAIRKGMNSQDPETRKKALLELARQGVELGYPAAVKAFRSKETEMRETALEAFEILRDLRIVPTLIQALWEDDEEFCKRVEQCLIVLTNCTVEHDADPDQWAKWWKKNEKKVREDAPAPKAGPGGQGKAVVTGTSFYGIPTHSNNVMFIIDVSGSMGVPIKLPEGISLAPPRSKGQPGVGPRASTRMGLAKWELKKAIAGLTDTSKFNIIYYSVNAQIFSKSKMCKATKSKKKAAFTFVDRLVAEGGTNIAEGLERAFMLADPKDDKKNL
ncbi:MAG: HEAT repeat domain-containing protein, partial [Planctomycetota bacterium]